MDRENIKGRQEPLLSICIPTYNRSAYLRGALENITSDPAFDDRVEIVISDNCSPDNTREVGEEFAAKFPNVRYFRNDTNLVDENFEIVLGHGEGKYLKLFNDTLRLIPGTLGAMLRIIAESDDSEPLYFYQDYEGAPTRLIASPDSAKSFLATVSFGVTWLANFGVWRKDRGVTANSKQYAYLQFTQVMWTLKLADSHKKSHVYRGDFYKIDAPKNKASYKVFNTFTDSYFKTLRFCGIKGLSLEKEKDSLFRNFLRWNIDSYLVFKEETGFDLRGAWRKLFSHYWYNPYCAAALVVKYLKSHSRKYNQKGS